MTSVTKLRELLQHYGETLARQDLPAGYRAQIRDASERTQILLEMEAAAREGGIQTFHEHRHRERPEWAFVHPSTLEAGKWRWTQFDSRGWMGHCDGFAEPGDAYLDMVMQGYIIPDQGRLQEFMGTELWRLGNEIIELRTKEHYAIRADDWAAVEAYEALIGTLAARMAEIQGQTRENPGYDRLWHAEVNARDLSKALLQDGHANMAEILRRCWEQEVMPLVAQGRRQEAAERLEACNAVAWDYRQAYKSREMGLKPNYGPRPRALAGGLGAGAKPGDFDPWELDQGVRVEMEHTRDPEVALMIAMDHLAEYPDYYTRLLAMEKEAEKQWHA